jgi:ATP-dependent Clp protease ATP-binding subunit ClpA
MPQMLAAYAEEPLIGRDREIGALREATAPRPGRRAVLILGEPGIDKTRHAAAAPVRATAVPFWLHRSHSPRIGAISGTRARNRAHFQARLEMR